MNKRGMPPKVAFLIIVVGLTMIIFGPLVTLWSLNTLFSLGIEYSFWSWLAMLWLSSVTFGSAISRINERKLDRFKNNNT